ncbi:polysaccharide biosynthesis protein [Falsirhodobacter halotolerans]|nr:nucleoside-diphosphate sugar epimerase/dehydratase [Falsirhodobacter halotolerans]MCJ8138336.1 polysaccharide biosynthesis protein [Falsirhodobacter halotolerans]
MVDALSRKQKQAVILTLDLILAPLALLLTCSLIHNVPFPLWLWGQVFPLLPVLSVLAGALSMLLGIYRIQLKAFEVLAIGKVAVASILLGLMMAGLIRMTDVPLPGAAAIVFALLSFLMSVGARYGLLYTLKWVLRQGKPRHKVLIYGAGTTGIQLAAALRSHDSIRPVAFVDDGVAVQGLTISGLTVLRPDQIAQAVQTMGVQRVLLAMPSASPARQAQIARHLEKRKLKVMTVPSFAQLVGEEKLVDHLAPVIPGRFLNRRQVESVMPEGAEAYTDRVIVVSGAGGSVGSELCRQLIVARPRRLVLFESSEIALYTIDRELRDMAEDLGVLITPVLGSVTDARLARMVMNDHAAEVVFHAAAYKHVPLVEGNPIAGLANNVLGTRTFADAAHEAGVARFILVSTDKAVRPTNIMGASKRLAELVIQDLALRSRGTVFSMVRFGNVLGSSGSVIPLFRDQIARGGPVTLTHEDVTRFFMTIAEAARLVMLAGSFAGQDSGGEVFVLDMGKPVKIRNLAQQMIEAAGYTVRDTGNPDGDIEIVVTGLRPGEKLHEELLIGEGLLTTPHPKIMRAREEALSELEMASVLRALRTAVALGDPEAARDVVRRWVAGYVEPAPLQAVSAH